MTVLRPSLPPLISTTTRIGSLPTSAARAVLARNCGTTPPNASKDEPCSVRARKVRRSSMIGSPRVLTNGQFHLQCFPGDELAEARGLPPPLYESCPGASRDLPPALVRVLSRRGTRPTPALVRLLSRRGTRPTPALVRLLSRRDKSRTRAGVGLVR